MIEDPAYRVSSDGEVGGGVLGVFMVGDPWDDNGSGNIVIAADDITGDDGSSVVVVIATTV